jgi:hypothetical protein
VFDAARPLPFAPPVGIIKHRDHGEDAMNPKKITAEALRRVFGDLRSGKDRSTGTYLFKGFRVQISRYQSSGTERSAQLYKKRRESGLCVRCGAKVTKRNPVTGKLYRLCDEHRKEIDRK